MEQQSHLINRTPSPDSNDSNSPTKNGHNKNYGSTLANTLFGDSVNDNEINCLGENFGDNTYNLSNSNTINLGS
jgi:hypothetical protein